MTGPQDRVAPPERPEHARIQESDHPHEPQSPRADLRSRAERLPDGHPSSPCRDDGSRKPAPPDLAKYELSPTGEAASRADRPDQHLPPEDKPRVDPDGSWHWKGHDLAAERAKLADQTHAGCRDAEGQDVDGNYGERGLTPAMRRIEAQLDHGHLVEDTEKYALKDPNRFKEKFARLIQRYPNADPSELVSSIPDGVRYTLVFEFEHYTAGVEMCQARLIDAGYDHVETQPGWDGDEYKGVNSRWRDRPSGVMFELQFHTAESWDAKQKTPDAYEKIQDKATPIEEAERLRAYQREISARVPIPPGALEIPPYKKGR